MLLRILAGKAEEDDELNEPLLQAARLRELYKQASYAPEGTDLLKEMASAVVHLADHVKLARWSASALLLIGRPQEALRKFVDQKVPHRM